MSSQVNSAMESNAVIIGIDCAVDPKKRGVAIGVFDGKSCEVSLPDACKTDAEIASIVSQYLNKTNRILLAIDAPLGWPANLANVLTDHVAGKSINHRANDIFRRATDQFIKEQIDLQPLDVGADRIARTAHAALGILRSVSEKLSRQIPLAWNPDFTGIAAIEVYPAATLKACRLRCSGYKEKDKKIERGEILLGIKQYVSLPNGDSPFLANADTLDASVCVLAGAHFLNGLAYTPVDQKLARKEGWIWVKSPSSKEK